MENTSQVLPMAAESCENPGFSIPISFKRFPQRLPSLAALGFDEMRTSDSSIFLRKNARGGILPGKGLLYSFEITEKSAKVSYGLPPGCDAASRRLRAAAMLVHILLLFEDAQIGAKDMARLLQPSLDEAEWALSNGVEQLAKSNKGLVAESVRLRASAKRLARELERANLVAMEKERKMASLSERLSTLEKVSDQSLREMLLEWLSSHSGRFDSAEFSKANGICPSRAEQGLVSLIAGGEIIEVGGALRKSRKAAGRVFEQSTAIGRILRLPSLFGKKS